MFTKLMERPPPALVFLPSPTHVHLSRHETDDMCRAEALKQNKKPGRFLPGSLFNSGSLFGPDTCHLSRASTDGHVSGELPKLQVIPMGPVNRNNRENPFNPLIFWPYHASNSAKTVSRSHLKTLDA